MAGLGQGGGWGKVRKNAEKVAEQYKHQDSSSLNEVRGQLRSGSTWLLGEYRYNLAASVYDIPETDYLKE